VHQIIQFQYKLDCQLIQNGKMKDVCMSPIRGVNVKSALQYNSQMRNMTDSQFMRHLGWLETSGRETANSKRSNNTFAPMPSQSSIKAASAVNEYHQPSSGYHYQAS